MKNRFHAVPGPSSTYAPTSPKKHKRTRAWNWSSSGGDKALGANALFRGKAVLALLGLLLLIASSNNISGKFGGGSTASDRLQYGPLGNSSSPFVSAFEAALLGDLVPDSFVPLVFDGGKLCCRRKHRRQMSRHRTRFFAQMVRAGLRLQHDRASIDVEGGLPILVMDGDGNGCNVHFRRDDCNYPRLSWSMLAPQRGECKAIGMPSYETWKYYHRSHRTEQSWERTFQHNERRYPWETKIAKAVWRGSTTYEGSQYGESALGDTPRGRLVAAGTEHPELIDAAFHKINQKFREEKRELAGQFRVEKRINPSEMMKYKAIIDIDGNNWSSRFGMLLCSNSVVIKIEPDFIEYFYDDGGDVKPMVHYVPASLDNITEVVSYVTDETNDERMREMVKSANSWCKASLSEEGLARDATQQLGVYKSALDAHDGSWNEEWKRVKRRFADTVDDLVECNAWSVVDPFTFPMFAGL